MNFQSSQQLEDWLRDNGINTSLWGSGSSKSIDNLWQELISGDCELVSMPPVRKVQVAMVYVYQNGHQLIEAVQTFSDGRQRHRNRPPSEKIRRGETAESAAIRCLYEELSCTDENILSTPRLLNTETVYRESPSYPSLPSEFTLYSLEVSVVGLPSGSFSTQNQAEDDPVETIRWYWRVLENSDAMSSSP